MRKRRWLLIETTIAAAVFAVLVTRVPTVEHFLVNPDHGYQLAAGAELLRGRLPGVDVLINYGPLVAVLAAGTMRATGNLVAEVLLCAAAWAAAVWLAFRLTRRNFGAWAGWCAGAFAFLCVARFHKWYVWLLPLAALAAVDGADDMPGKGRWTLGGLVCGAGALLRPELGVAGLVVLVALGLADTFRGRSASWTWLAIGFAVPLIVWGTIVAMFGGFGSLTRVLRVVPESLAGSVAYWSKSPPPFRWDDPFSPASAHALALYLLPGSEIAALLVGGWLYLDPRRGLEREGRALAAIGLMGLACYPHTIYRADIHHLWQGIWPLALAVPGLVSVGRRLLGVDRNTVRRAAAGLVLVAATVLAILSTAGLAPILRQPHYDLAPYGRPPLAGLQALAAGVAVAPNHPYAQLVATIDRVTAPSDEILILVFAPQLLVFAERGASGPVVTFQRGLFDSPEWRAERLAQLQRHPPALVVVPLRFWQLGPDDDLRASVPEIYDFVRDHYQRLVDRRGNFMVLEPDATFRPPSL